MPSEPSIGAAISVNMLDLLPLGVCVIDSEMRVCEWNATLAEWTGISKDAALGMNLAQRFPRLATWSFRDRLSQVFSHGTPTIFSAAFHRYFLPVESRQGGCAGNMIQQTIVRPLDETAQRAMVMIQDVTAQYLQMEELREERTRLQNVAQ
jgi:PAS domain S-box-containing protein